MNSYECTRFTDLPNDVLLEIAWFLRPQDLLTMTAISRALRRLFLEDVVWRQARSEWPLDVPVGLVPNDLDGSDLRRLHIKSIKLESMWGSSRAPSKVGGITTPAIVHSIQFLGSQWLLTLGGMENQVLGGMMTLWSLEDLQHIHVACSFNIVAPHCFGFAAAWRKGTSQIVIAVYTSNKSMQVHSMYRHQGIWGFDHVLTLHGLPNALNSRNQLNLRICDYMVAWCTKANGAAYVWLINSITKRCFCAKLGPIFTGADVPIALVCIELGRLIVVTGSWMAEDTAPAQVVHVSRLPSCVLDADGHVHTQSALGNVEAVTPEDLDLELITCYESPHFQIQPPTTPIQAARLDVAINSYHELTVVQHSDEANSLTFNRFPVDIHYGLRPTENPIFFDTTGHNEINVLLCRSGQRGFYTALVVSDPNTDHTLILRKFIIPGHTAVVPLDELVQAGHMFSCVSFDDATGRFCTATWGFHPFHSGMVICDFVD